MLARALIVLLLVLNLGVAVWWVAHDPPAPTAPLQVPSGVARLELVSERKLPAVLAAAPAPAAPAQAATATAAPAPLQCFSFGPLTKDAAAAGAAKLKPLVRTVTSREQAAAGRGWRVYLPPLPSPDQAEAVAERIKAAGFSDLLVVREGAEANSIALGRFSSEAAARKHADALNSAGFAAQAESLGDAAVWLNVVAEAGFDAPAAQRAVGAAQHRSIDCPQLR